MNKHLQFIIHKIGLALSLSLVFINQLSALAETNSDKTKWLSNSLATKIDNEPSTITLKTLPAQEDNRQKSLSFRAVDSSEHNVKLRPFKPNRKLPSRHELELALVEQKAKLAEENNLRLNGQVSAFAIGAGNNNQAATTWSTAQYNLSQTNNRNYNNGNYSKQSAAKSRPANFSFIKQAEQHLLSTMMAETKDIPVHPPNVTAAINPLNNISNQAPIVGTANLMSESPQAPAMEIYSSGFISPSASTALPSSETGFNQTASSGFGNSGPPPFPLNLVPETALKQLIRSLARGRTANTGNTPKAAFGSWRNDGSSNNLSYGGFQSHLKDHSLPAVPTSNITTYRVCTLPSIITSPTRSKIHQTKTANTSRPKDAAARNRMLIESQVKVAAYPSYAKQSLRPWNFAQQ